MATTEGNNWGTKSELSFIRTLGSKGTLINRIVKLEGYLKATKLRKEWGSIDRSKCIEKAEELLAECKEELRKEKVNP